MYDRYLGSEKRRLFNINMLSQIFRASLVSKARVV